jgi:hypothetical protein
MPSPNAIDQGLRLRQRRVRHNAIAAYAAEMAGTEFDLDPELESAAIDHLTAVVSGLKSALDLD